MALSRREKRREESDTGAAEAEEEAAEKRQQQFFTCEQNKKDNKRKEREKSDANHSDGQTVGDIGISGTNQCAVSHPRRSNHKNKAMRH